MKSPRIWISTLALLALWGVASSLAHGQSSSKKLGGLGQFGLSNSSIPCEFSASYELEEGTGRGVLKVTATPDAGYHIFSTTQPDDGPIRTTIKPVDSSVQVKSTFEPDASPHISFTESGFEGKAIEMHEEPVTWTASIELAEKPTSEPSPIELIVDGQVCIEGKCIGIRGQKVTAKFSGYYASAKSQQSTGPFREPDAYTEWTVQLSHTKAKAGDQIEILLRGKPDKDFHLYKYDPTSDEVESRTLIQLKQKAGLKASRPIANKSPKHKDFGGGIKVDYYDGEVEWRIPLKVPAQAIPNTYPLVGHVGYQSCTDGSCDQPRGIEFRLELEITDGVTDKTPTLAAIKAIPYKTIAESATRNKWIDEVQVATLGWGEILAKFCLAMLGGLILNVMPCVLPVIGLKILGFVSEAAGDKKSASRLTLVYAMGIISLILGLGVLSVTVRQITGQAYGWGEQFGSLPFRIASTAFMFSLALSFLGVWEIPIPGFAMSKTSTEMSNRQGYLGAFFKGLITTILATPCSAPFLGGVFLVALNQPSWVVLIIFFGVGLGMALPYLLIAAQPSLLSFIPKPGPWMETFKEFLAFPMLLAVVMFVDGFAGDQKIAMMASLMFVWFACWMIGRVPIWSDIGPKLRGWGVATAVAIAGTVGSFYLMQPSPYRLAWKSYNEEQLDSLVADGKTVLIDFTAEWCQNCKLNLNRAIHTKKVKEWVEKNNVVAMEADLTEYPPHIKDKLNELESISIPVLAIYRPGDTETPIVLRDLVSEKDVLAALEKAGPSKPASAPSNSSSTASGSAAKPTSTSSGKSRAAD